MAANIKIYQSDGTTEITDGIIPGFGVLGVGETSSTVTIIIKNEGTSPANGLVHRIVQESTLDGEMHCSVGGTPVTDEWTPIGSGTLNAASSLTLEFWFSIPALATPVAEDTATYEFGYYG